MADLALNTLDRFPASTLGLYQIGLVTLAKLDELDDRFDVLAHQAASDGIGALDSTRDSMIPADAAQRERMLQIADRCPVHRTLHAEVAVRSRLED